MKALSGATILRTRRITAAEREAHGWGSWEDGTVAEVVLVDGTPAVLVPLRDPEGNGLGAFELAPR